MTPVVVIPARGGNDLSKPLDSGLRRNDDKGGFLGGLFQTCLQQAGAGSRGQRHTNLQTPAPTAILRPMQPQPTFDTHAFVKRLTKAGMSEDQALLSHKHWRAQQPCFHENTRAVWLGETGGSGGSPLSSSGSALRSNKLSCNSRSIC